MKMGVLERLHGVHAASITPYLAQGVLDEQGIRNLVDYYVESGLNGVLFPSSTGESFSMPREQRLRTVAVAAAHATGRLLIMGNASESNIKDAVRMCKQMAADGADIAVCMPPTFLSYSQEELREFFFRIADESPIPIVVYNHLVRLPNKIQIPLLMELRKHEHIIGIKDTHNDAARMMRLYAVDAQKDFAILCGGDGMASYSALLDMDMLNALCAVSPKLFLNIRAAGRAGNMKKVALLQEEVNKLMGLFNLLKNGLSSSSLFSQAIKVVLRQKGICGCDCAQMGFEVSPEDDVRVRQLMLSIQEDIDA